MIASAQASAASMNATVTAGPAKSPAARAPTEKIPAPTTTATPKLIMPQSLSERLSPLPGSDASGTDCTMALGRNRVMRGVDGKRAAAGSSVEVGVVTEGDS